MICAMVLVNDVFDKPHRDAIHVQGLQTKMTIVKGDLEPIQISWTKYGCSIMIDGWSDMKQQNINIFVFSCRGTIVLRSINTYVELLGASVIVDYIHGHIIQAIMDVKLANVVQVVTNNTNNCKLMGSMIMKEFPHIV
jgi:hypothetical protein